MVVTTIFMAFKIQNEKIAVWQNEHFYLFWICVISIVLIYTLLFCKKHIARRFPINLILLVYASVCKTYVLSEFLYPGETKLVSDSIFHIFMLISFGFAGMTLYSLTRRTHILIHHGMLWGTISYLIAYTILFCYTHATYKFLILSMFVVPLLLLYVAVDTHMIIKAHRYGISADDYLVGYIILYIDFFTQFRHIKNLLCKKKR
mgnify:CR=1 FL=1